MRASYNGHLDAVKLLPDRGADPNLQDFGGRTALMWAAAYGTPDLLDNLLEHGADPDVRDHYGRTGLMWVCLNPDSEVLKVVLSWGPDLEARDEVGRTALSCSEALGYYQLPLRGMSASQPWRGDRQ
jgi:ankyrin repeat protein